MFEELWWRFWRYSFESSGRILIYKRAHTVYMLDLLFCWLCPFFKTLPGQPLLSFLFLLLSSSKPFLPTGHCLQCWQVTMFADALNIYISSQGICLLSFEERKLWTRSPQCNALQIRSLPKCHSSKIYSLDTISGGSWAEKQLWGICCKNFYFLPNLAFEGEGGIWRPSSSWHTSGQ